VTESAERARVVVDARLVLRHQAAAAIGTAADFGTMIALVELVRLAPPVATMISAMMGGIVNFSVSRAWAFRQRHDGSFRSQAMRYALASAGGALLNAFLLSLVLRALEVPYPLARAGVAIVVSLLYTYPVHTRIVFRVGERRPA
jgi:putative flippase GtrA